MAADFRGGRTIGTVQFGVDSTGARVWHSQQCRASKVHRWAERTRGESDAGAAAIAAAAAGIEPAPPVQLNFRLEPHRKVDLDNVLRPALAGLRDAGVWTRGYRSLDAILATKTAADDEVGVDIDPTTADVVVAVTRPTAATMVVAHTMLPRDGDRSSNSTGATPSGVSKQPSKTTGLA